MADSYELIFYDHAGNGRSPAPMDCGALNHDLWVDEAEALRVHLGLGRVVVFGHSWGGFIAQEFALKYPESLSALILCSPAPALDHGAAIVANAQARGTAPQVAALLAARSQLQTPHDATASCRVCPVGEEMPSC